MAGPRTNQAIDDQSGMTRPNRRVNLRPDGQRDVARTAAFTISLCSCTALNQMCGQQAYVNPLLDQSEGGRKAITAIVSWTTQNPNWTETLSEALEHSNRLSRQSLTGRFHQI